MAGVQVTGHAINQIGGPVGNTPELSSGEPGFETRSGLFGAFQIVPVLDPDTGTIQNQIFAVKRDSIGPQTLCCVCGGRGHVSRIDGITCSTIELGVKIPRPLLETTNHNKTAAQEDAERGVVGEGLIRGLLARWHRSISALSVVVVASRVLGALSP